MASTTLFTVPILESPYSDKSRGTFVCTSSAPGVYLLTFTSPPDNRLLTSFCESFLLALDIIESSFPPGVVITTSGIPKFYSNGLDLEHAGSTKGFFSNSLFKLYARILTYPMPTIALLNGHAFAGGLMLAMYHDYRVFNPSRGYLCLNELDFGYPLKPAMSRIFKDKISNPAVYRSMILEAKRFGAQEALEGGIVDRLGGIEEVTALIGERKLTEKAKSGIYGVMKGDMYKDTLALLFDHDNQEKRDGAIKAANSKRREEAASRVKEWERNTGSSKAKL